MGDLQDYSVPQWLDKGFLERVLLQRFPGGIEVQSLQVEVASKKGEGFVSEMFRLRVESSVGDLHLILKKPHSHQERYDILAPYHMFAKEIEFYAHVFPALRSALEAVAEGEPLVPEMFYGDRESEMVLMDDLGARGYRTPQRDRRVSLAGAKVVMRKLAKLHAASMAVNRAGGGRFEGRVFHSFSVDGKMKELLDIHMRALHAELESWGAEFERICGVWGCLAEDFMRLASENVVSSHGNRNVLIHGDLWFSNIMCRSGAQPAEVEDVLLIDFQVFAWGSLATDLIHFFFTSLDEQHYEGHLDELLGEYHGHLERCLRKLHWTDIPSVGDLWREMDDKLIHAIYSCIAKALFEEDPGDARVENLLVNDVDYVRRKFQKERIRRELQYILKFMERRGAFDRFTR